MILLVTSCATLNNGEQSQGHNIKDKQNVESQYTFSENVGIYYVNKKID